MPAMKRDLNAMLRPRSIALVGATDRSRWSQNTFDNLINRKYPGEVHLVSRRGGTVHGRSAATSCVAVGAPIDLALLMVPMAAIDEALADLAAADVHNAVILTSGFAETGTKAPTTRHASRRWRGSTTYRCSARTAWASSTSSTTCRCGPAASAHRASPVRSPWSRRAAPTAASSPAWRRSTRSACRTWSPPATRPISTAPTSSII